MIHDLTGRFYGNGVKEAIDYISPIDITFKKEYYVKNCVKEKDWGKEFFEWSKAKCREWGIPVSTFKTIKETRQIAKRLTEEWCEKFETIEEFIDFLEEEEICLK
jgi:hypothetical protein